jgi:hypothetical protein
MTIRRYVAATAEIAVHRSAFVSEGDLSSARSGTGAAPGIASD